MNFFKKPSLDDIIFDLKFSEKQISRFATKSEGESTTHKAKLKKALLAKNYDAARIHAEDSIRKHKESIQYMTLASRLDAVQARLKSAATMKEMTKDLGRVTSRLKSSMASMNLEKIDQIMGDFEKTFTDLDVRTATIEDSMGTAVVTSAPEDQIFSLIRQVAEENGLEVQQAIAGAPVPMDSVVMPSIPGASTAERTVKAEDTLTQRLAALRQ